MTEKMELLIHLIVSLVRLLKPGGMKVVMAETMILKPRIAFLRARFFNLSKPSTRLVRQRCDKTTEH
jgi:hypothetical protein